MANNFNDGHSFFIKELNQGSEQQSGSLKTKPLTAPIEWTTANYSKPRETWKIKKKLRTSRNDYSDKPVEQVLGIQYEPFTLSGVWDNKFNGGSSNDYAWKMKEVFEQLQDRGGLCEFTFDSISITGLITEFEIQYKMRSYIGYSFTVSPHYRPENAGNRKVPKLAKPPKNYLQELVDKINTAAIAQVLGPIAWINKGTATLISGFINSASQIGLSAYDQCSQYINGWSIAAANIDSIISNRLGNGSISIGTNQTAIQRVIQEFTNMDSMSKQLISYLKSAKATDGLIYQDALQYMNYQNWIGTLKTTARQMLEVSFNAQQEYNKLIVNEVIAIYKPSQYESLYEISQKFYGTPNQWRSIYEQNDLQSLVLHGDELLVIPKVN